MSFGTSDLTTFLPLTLGLHQLQQCVLPPFLPPDPLVSSTTSLLCSSLVLKRIGLLVVRLGKMITKCFAMVCLPGACTDLWGIFSLQELHWQVSCLIMLVHRLANSDFVVTSTCLVKLSFNSLYFLLEYFLNHIVHWGTSKTLEQFWMSLLSNKELPWCGAVPLLLCSPALSTCLQAERSKYKWDN